MAKQAKTTKVKDNCSAIRPADYSPQPGNKATLSLADFTDETSLRNSGVEATTENFVSSKSSAYEKDAKTQDLLVFWHMSSKRFV